MLSFRIVLAIASACPVYPVENLEENEIVKRQTILSSQERKSLIGHLQGLEGRTLVLTERQKLALRQELALQEEGFGAFSPDSDKGGKPEIINRPQQELPRNYQQFSNRNFENSQEQFQTKFSSRNRFSSERKSFPSTKQHPEVLLNQLPPADKLLFQAQFNKLSQELQEFSYNKFLSSSPEVQSFAINQFLSLPPDQLEQSIRSEKNKETDLQIEQRQQRVSPAVQNPRFVDQPLSPSPKRIETKTSSSFLPQQQRTQVEKELELFQAEASKADQLALQQQVEALKNIIAQQRKINFAK